MKKTAGRGAGQSAAKHRNRDGAAGPPESNSLGDVITNNSWKATVGYTAAQWNAPGSEVVSCDAAGDKYVLGKAVILGSQVTSATAEQLQSNGQWAVNLTLDSAATQAFGTLTTSQYNNYYPSASINQDDAALDSTAIVLDGNVQSAPVTDGPITSGKLMIAGPQTNGFTHAEAEALAAQLSTTTES